MPQPGWGVEAAQVTCPQRVTVHISVRIPGSCRRVPRTQSRGLGQLLPTNLEEPG